jgi:hypothetical protein
MPTSESASDHPPVSTAHEPPTDDTTLHREQQHLLQARTALRRMREHTAGLTAVGGNHVSTEHLKQVLYRRMKALEDDPGVPLFFGRLDYDTRLGGELDETLYIGRRHVTGEIGGEPMVIDWRAQMSLPFYQARPGEPMGVRSRRRFGFSHGQLTAYEDEDLTSVGGVAGLESEILESEIERPRTGPMRDIVATIQPEQDRIVRARLADSLCIQGAPGTGKTAVGLHRAAYLLYAYRDQLARSGVLVVGPNDSFLSYIGDVLPALGEIDATQATVSSLVSRLTTISTNGSTGTGLKKCTPTTWPGRFVALAILMTGIDEVFVARIPSGLTMASSLPNRSSFSDSISGAASTTRSRSAKSLMSRVNVIAVRAFSAASASIRPDLTARANDLSRRASAASAVAWLVSRISTELPERAHISAIPAPMVPPPMTPTRLMSLI